MHVHNFAKNTHINIVTFGEMKIYTFKLLKKSMRYPCLKTLAFLSAQ